MDADDSRTRSTATVSVPPLRLHDPGRKSEPVAVRFPRFPVKDAPDETPSQQARVVLGTTRKTETDLDRIRPGDLIVLDQPADSPLSLIWQDEIVARVELVQLEGVTVWRVVETVSSERREESDV
ncbi:MAG TPA: FliM/FliN family flagellar motor C-terminal domain-containing protein [Planctomycetaceae bacterium]|nr:FliM/FliN family flagellar motor C-terminal domain-containing protein [Planctomycetaceae bacterium]